MIDKSIYVVAKIFDQQGCIAYRCKTINEQDVYQEHCKRYAKKVFK